MTVPNGWIDNARPKSWGLNEEREQFEIVFETPSGTITWWGGFKTEAAKKYTENQMMKCGWCGDWDDLTLSTNPVSILVEEETYNGKTRQKVKAVGNGGGEGQRAPKDPVKARSLIDRLKGGAKHPSDPFGNAPSLSDPEDDGRAPPF
jgi:hypothetical protein